MTDTPGWVIPSLLVSTVFCILVSYLSFSSGFFIIVQNLYYIPIIIACIYYGWRGLLFSIILAFCYLAMFASFTLVHTLLQEAIVRVVFFSIVAGVITVLSRVKDEAETALRDSELFNRTLIEHLPDYVILYDPDGRIQYINPSTAVALGYTVEEIIGDHIFSFVPDESHDILWKKLAERSMGRKVSPYELRIRRKDGRLLTVLVQGALMQYEDSPSTLVVLTDITGRKIEEELRSEAFSQIEDNMYRLSILNDQIRNPLSVISGLVDLEPGPHTDQILEQIDEINRIITLLDLGVLESESIRSFMRKHDHLTDIDRLPTESADQ